MSPHVPIASNLFLAAWKEIRRMSRRLNRILDTVSHLTVVCLALYLGAATLGLGVF